MDKPMIGIRQADGSFYEILDETADGHKRLILSAARSEQKGARIELFRSVDGKADPEGSLGTISLEDAEGLDGKNIEFRIDLKDGRLDASAALPGQPPQTLSVDLSVEDVPRRTDAAILDDEALGTGLDTLDDSFSETEPELEPTMIDLPDLRDEETEAGAPETFEMPDMDDSDFELPGLDEPEVAATEAAAPAAETLDTEADTAETEAFDMPEMESLDDLDLSSMDEPEAPATEELATEEMAMESLDAESFDAESFDMPDMDEPTLDEPTLGETPLEPEAEPAAAAESEFSIDDLGDMEPMEFMDTGAELSAPAAKPVAETDELAEFDVSMDSESEHEFGDLSDLGDLPDMDESPSANPAEAADDDLDFMAPPELTETPWADEPEETVVAKPGKPGKPPKSPKTKKSRSRDVPVPATQGGGLDKTALFLSLTSLSLLVLLILVLLFLNMIKSPQPTVIQPEVMKFTPTAPLARRVAPISVDLAAGTTFEASTVLEVPEALRVAEVSLTLAPGDTAADAERRFGPPAKARGNQLFW